jgi:uncharacterized repeat protein (TIGR04138 family)
MTETMDLLALAQADGRYAVEAYALVGEGLQAAAAAVGSDACACRQHVSATDLVCQSLRLAAERFGLLAPQVLRSWGLVTSMDFGRVTFLLIRSGIVAKQDDDQQSDFDGGPSPVDWIRDYLRVHPSC